MKATRAPGKPRVGGYSWPRSVAVTPNFGAGHSPVLQHEADKNTKQLPL